MLRIYPSLRKATDPYGSRDSSHHIAGGCVGFDRSVQSSIQEQLLHRNVQQFRGGLVFKAHRLVYHSTLGLRVIKKKKFRVPGEGFKLQCVALRV